MAYAYLAKLLKISQGAGGEASDLERLEHARVPEAKVGGRACAAASCSRDPSEAEPQLAAGSFADEPRWSGRLLPRKQAGCFNFSAGSVVICTKESCCCSSVVDSDSVWLQPACTVKDVRPSRPSEFDVVSEAPRAAGDRRAVRTSRRQLHELGG